MFRNYLKIALRNIAGNPLFSSINILGLAIGLACCIIITVFVGYELSYDKQWTNADRIHRVTRDFYGNDLRLAPIAPPIGPLLKQDFPEIEDVTRIMDVGDVTLRKDGELIQEDNFAIADPNVFDFFNLKFIIGDPGTALARPTDLVLSQRMAKRLFGNEDPIGKSLNIMGQMDLTVTAIIEDIPDNTHMRFEALLSSAAIPMILGEDEFESWGSNNYYTYIRLPVGYNAAHLEERLPDFLIKHRGEDAAKDGALHLQPLTEIYLTSNRDAEWRVNGSYAVVYTFSAVAFVVLLIACVNFMNLTTARSTQRAKEVGIRKVVGASRRQLIMQFLGESILMSALAMLLAVAIVELTLPSFAAFLEKPLHFSLAEPESLAWLLGGTLLVGLVAGSYPAFYLSHFRPAAVLKGASEAGSSALLRRLLVVFQFATSIVLLIATGVVMAQMHYAKNVDLGYDKSRNIVTGLPFFSDLWQTYEPLRTELEAHPDIESVVFSSRVPSMQNLDGSGYVAEGEQITPDSVLGIADIKVDAHWFDHYKIKFLAGRTFRPNEVRIETPSKENPVVKGYAVLNESAARRFNWTPEEAIGKVIRQPMSRDLDLFIDREIIGVIPDIHFSSLHDKMKATVYAEPNPNYARNLSIRIAPGDPTAAIEHIEKTWARLVPDSPIDWQFLDDQFEARYRAEAKQARMFAIFSLFAVFVATLGLFGLASFTTERRTKEIGIRKVMGASVKDIILLLTADFTRLVLIANVIAWPVAYFFMQRWLGRFAYQAPFADWAWLFVASALVALAAAWITIALQAGKAARSRPVLALRYE
ncbi:MAG TPA: ABC transporter permease [Woeseiaceae bacterium]|nr:ABC transporter permease [Woeseiaceae bacterium]